MKGEEWWSTEDAWEEEGEEGEYREGGGGGGEGEEGVADPCLGSFSSYRMNCAQGPQEVPGQTPR